MPYPPVVQRDSSFAHTAVAGEYVQRLCPGEINRVRGDARDEEVKHQALVVVVACNGSGGKVCETSKMLLSYMLSYTSNTRTIAEFVQHDRIHLVC